MGTSGEASGDKKKPEEYLYFPVEGVSKSEIDKLGKKKVTVNGEDLALFSVQKQLYAVQHNCPHAGGPLHEGDIEELPSRNGYCIKCPWHSWKFDISTGQCVSPQNRYSRFLKTYPVKFDCKGKISVGFASIDPALFSTPPE